MGYKLLGWAVWNGGVWYLRRRYGTAARRALVAGGAAALVGAAAVALRSGDE